MGRLPRHVPRLVGNPYTQPLSDLSTLHKCVHTCGLATSRAVSSTSIQGPQMLRTKNILVEAIENPSSFKSTALASMISYYFIITFS